MFKWKKKLKTFKNLKEGDRLLITVQLLEKCHAEIDGHLYVQEIITSDEEYHIKYVRHINEEFFGKVMEFMEFGAYNLYGFSFHRFRVKPEDYDKTEINGYKIIQD